MRTRNMKMMMRLAIGASAALVLASGTSLAGDRGTGGNIQIPHFVEKPGSLEFSGAMIARPVQNDPVKHAAAQQFILQNFAIIKVISLNDEYVFELPHGVTENDAAQMVMSTGNFEYIQPDWICYPQLTPNDPKRTNQWQHTRMDSYNGWDVQIGTPDIRVGICDTGLRTTHEEFRRFRADGWNAVRGQWESQGGDVSDINGHGTHTSGDAAANGNNLRGGLGVGWELGTRILRVSESPGGGAQFSTLTSAALMAAQSGDKCSSVSYSGSTEQSVRTTGTTIKSLGGLLFWAAGNESQNLDMPGRDDDDVIIVGASTSGDGRASFSNYGNYVDLFAPGNNIYSTYNDNDHSYAVESGTSMACPIAAGVGAMIFANNPGITPDQVEEILKSSCDDIGAAGVDTIFGYGRVNLNAAMHAAPPPPPFMMTVGGQCPGWVTVEWFGAANDSMLALLYSGSTGHFTLPPGPCHGTTLGLGGQGLQVVGTFRSGTSGHGTQGGVAAQGACGGYLQMIDHTGCRLSNLGQIP